MTDYKKYSLDQLDNWLHDCMSCDDITPQEIYDKIYHVVKEQYEYYKHQTNRIYDLMLLLNNNANHIQSLGESKLNSTYDNMVENGFTMTADGFWVKETQENSWFLRVELDMASGEYYVTLPDELLTKANWKENDELEWRYQEDGTIKLSKVDVT